MGGRESCLQMERESSQKFASSPETNLSPKKMYTTKMDGVVLSFFLPRFSFNCSLCWPKVPLHMPMNDKTKGSGTSST
jgi:hypothetical protein